MLSGRCTVRWLLLRKPCEPHSAAVPCAAPPLRMPLAAYPARRAVAANQTGVHYVDCSTRFLNAGHTAIDAALMPDALHPSAAGMERGIAQCIKPLVDALMKG